MTEGARRYQDKLHRDFEMYAERNRLAGVQFTAAYWDHLRGLGPEPVASGHHLSEQVADALRRQCEVEFRSKKECSARGKTASAGVDQTGDAPARAVLRAGVIHAESPGPAQPIQS